MGYVGPMYVRLYIIRAYLGLHSLYIGLNNLYLSLHNPHIAFTIYNPNNIGLSMPKYPYVPPSYTYRPT